MNENKGSYPTAIPTANPSRFLPVPRLSTLVALVIVGFLIYAFFARLTLQFYASIVFLFYALTNSMWISVVLLGVFQTLLLIPFRVVNLIKSANIKEFREKFKEIEQKKEQQYFLRQSIKQGRNVALFYLVNFAVQLVSYTSIGRLFLTDFYSTPLDENLLYDFVPYPDYPIRDRFFKIPYPWFDRTVDLGMKWVVVAWLVILGIQAAIYVYRGIRARMKVPQPELKGPQSELIKKVKGLVAGRMVVLMALAWWLIRNFPVGWEFRIFRGDVSVPNRTLNTITALVTFGTLIWINMPKIEKKVELAREAGMDEEVVKQTEKELFQDTIKVAAFVGLGAFFITNHIPSAFELSIFTLEMIALFSPLTLDRIILKSRKAVLAPVTAETNGEAGSEKPITE